MGLLFHFSVEMEAVYRHNHGEPHSTSFEGRVRGKTAHRLGSEGAAIVPDHQGGEALPQRRGASALGSASVFRLALAEGYTDRDPTAALFTPKEAAPSPSLTLSKEEVEQYINELDPRERVIALLAIFAGMRPGEILALQRRHVSGDCRKVRIEQRIYRGDIDTPKTTNSARTVAIPPKTATSLKEWMELVPGEPEEWVFASENPSTPCGGTTYGSGT